MSRRAAGLLVLLAACGGAQRGAASTVAEPPARVRHDPRAVQLLADAAAQLAKSGDRPRARARALLERAVARDASLWEAHYDLGVLALLRAAPESARGHLERAHALAPAAPEPLLALARCAVDEGDLARADALLAQLIARDAGHVEARLARAAVLRGRGDMEGAIAEARAVLIAQPTQLGALLELARAWRQAERPALSTLVLERARELVGEHAAIENEHGLLALAADDSQRAFSHFVRATELAPGFVPAHVNHAAVLLRAGDAEAAERAYRAALAALATASAQPGGSSESDVRVGLAISLRAQGKHRAARAEYERILTDHPTHPAALFDLGVLLADFDGQRKQAIAPFERYLESTSKSDPHRARAERYLQDIRMSLGDPVP